MLLQLGSGTSANAAGSPFQLTMGSPPSFSHHTACCKTLIQLLGNIQIPAVGERGKKVQSSHGAEDACARLLRDECKQKRKVAHSSCLLHLPSGSS